MISRRPLPFISAPTSSTRTAVCAAALGAAGLLLSACGQGGEAPAPAPAPAPDAAAEPSPAAAPAEPAYDPSRDVVEIVGSSTVAPFSTTVAEFFGAKTEFPTPKVERTGTGGGMKIFCQGDGEGTADVTNSSRRMKAIEWNDCQANGVTDIVEVKFGYDGIVVAHDVDAPTFELTIGQLFLAVAEKVPGEGGLVANPYKLWSDIDPGLPNQPIKVLGPPPTSGTRDAFVEVGMEKGAEQFDMLMALKAVKPQDAETGEAYCGRIQELVANFDCADVGREGALLSGGDLFKIIAHKLREDGAWVDAGENDNVIVQQLTADIDAVGVFGYSFLEQNLDVVEPVPIDGVAPTYETVASAEYPISRTMYFYVKKTNAEASPAVRGYLAEFVSEASWGDEGYLIDKGLIPLPEDERLAAAERAVSLTVMTAEDAADLN